MFIEEIYFSETEKGRYSGFGSNPAISTGINRIVKTRPERVFDEITPDNVEYVGNRVLKIRTKNKIRYPDFKIVGQNKIIEIFGIYYHDILKVKDGGKPDNPKDLIREYKEVGYNCLIFWEYEILKNSRKEYPKSNLDRVLKRTLEFIK